MAEANSEDSRSKFENPPWVSVIIALLALVGSLGGSWILAGAKFEKELEAKNTEINDLTQRMTEFKKQMDAATNLPDKVSRLQDEVGGLQGSVNNLSRVTSGLEASVSTLSQASSQEKERGFGAASTGAKACKIRVDGHWIDTIAVPQNATAQQCETLAQLQGSGTGPSHYSLGCVFGDRFVWAVEGGVPPSPNCGW